MRGTKKMNDLKMFYLTEIDPSDFDDSFKVCSTQNSIKIRKIK